MSLDALGRRRAWTVSDYEEIERLSELGLRSDDIGQLVDPPVTGRTIRLAAMRAGIRLGVVGRPTNEENARRRRVFAVELARRQR